MDLQETTMLITGGTGSFGKKALTHFLHKGIKAVRIFSRDEKKQHEMMLSIKDPRVTYYIGDVRDYDSINKAMKGVDVVFHASAMKHVPFCETFPIQAIKTNILGSINVLDACVNNNIKKVVLLSTDKACYPINTMGLTKSIMEKVGLNYSTKLNISVTRYGNVMCSRGSVIPIFYDLATKNESLHVTDPHMTRFLMTLDEAVLLVEHAFRFGKTGYTYVLKTDATSIENIAKAVIKDTNSKSTIVVVGTRAGEKKDETLITSEEMERVIETDNYYVITPKSINATFTNKESYISTNNMTVEQTVKKLNQSYEYRELKNSNCRG